MEKLVWCLAVVVAVSGCATPKGRYSDLKEESLKALTLDETVKASRPRKVRVGRKFKVKLEKSDDILLTSDGASSSSSYYVSYYRLYSFAVVAGKRYTLTVKSMCDCLGFQKLVAVPDAYVVDGEGRLVSRVLQYVHQDLEESFGGLIGAWEFTAEANGRYFLVLAANNSDPGQPVGSVVGYMVTSNKLEKLEFPMQSSTTGLMDFEITSI